MPTHTKFKGTTEYGDMDISSQVRDNLKIFLDWGFLEIGAFANIRIPTSGAYGGNFHQLIPSNDPRYDTGKVWQSARKDWVWESGMEYGTALPVKVSGVYVNNIFHPGTGIGAFAHVVDHPNGRLIFHTPISTASTVHCEYSFRRVQVVSADSTFFKQIQQDSYRVDAANFVLNSGSWGQMPENRLQLPAVGIEIVPRRTLFGVQLGGGHYMNQDVNLYIVSDNPEDRNTIQDILSKQQDKGMFLFDINAMANANQFPLTISGSINPSGNLAYSHNIQAFQWKQYRITKSQIQSIGQINSSLFGSIVQLTLQIDMPEI